MKRSSETSHATVLSVVLASVLAVHVARAEPTPTPTCSCPSTPCPRVTPEVDESGLTELLVEFAQPADIAPDAFGEARWSDRYAGAGSRERYVVQVPKHALAEVVRRIGTLKGVDFVEPNSIQQPQQPTPNDPSFSSQVYLHKPNAFGNACPDSDLNAPEAWQALGWPGLCLECREVVVGVVDTGVDAALQDLKGRIDAHAGINLAGGGTSKDFADGVSHGTNMAAIIAAVGDNGVAGAGVMWGAKIVPCKFAETGFDGKLNDAIRCFEHFAALHDQGLKIVAVNYSYGALSCSCGMEAAIRSLRDRGILLVASAGNESGDNDGPCPMYPASFPLSNIISVTAADGCGVSVGMKGRHSVHVAAGAQGVVPLKSPGIGGMSSSSAAAAQVTGLVALLSAQDVKSDQESSTSVTPRDWKALRNLVIAGGRSEAYPAGKTISDRTVRAWDAAEGPSATDVHGSMTCSGQKVRRRVWPRGSTGTPDASGQITFRVLSIECAHAAGPVTANASNSPQGIDFRDDGLEPDDVADDGEWAARWQPPGSGQFTVKFDGTPSADDLVVIVP